MAYQSLYRRYRPRRFDEVRGQEHVVGALRNAVKTNSVTHAYLFSGPRGTGKTSTARILAKALNCENLQDGEPCCDCTPCQDMEAGRSFDLFELDAASNNGVDAIRDLIERTAVGSPGRTKVYILDEVHMLSPAASNALLKTLEEPPDHVRFVLATTDPQKVLPTIRSRTQHFEFQLLSAQELETYVRWVNNDADLGVEDESLAWAVRQGRGSARDTLSALDQVVAAGGVIERREPVAELFRALAEHDSGAAVGAVADALAQGHDPKVLAKSFLDALRDAFLLSLDAEVPHMMAAEVEEMGSWASKLGTAALTRSMEAIGAAMVDMRQAADPRVPLEVALVRLTLTASSTAEPGAGSLSAEASELLADLSARVAKLERALASGIRNGDGSSTPSAVRSTQHSNEAASGPARARAELRRRSASSTAPDAKSSSADVTRRDHAASGSGRAERTVPAVPPTPPKPPVAGTAERSSSRPASAPATDRPAASSDSIVETPAGPDELARGVSRTSGDVDLASLRSAMDEVVLAQMRGVAKAIYSQGQFIAVADGVGIFAVENVPTRDRANKSRQEVQDLLSAHFGSAVRIDVIDKADSGKYVNSDPPGESQNDDGDSEAGRRPESRSDLADENSAAERDEEDLLDVNVDELENADGIASTGLERILEAFPGAKLVETKDDEQ